MSQVTHPWHKHPLNRDWNDDGWACDGRNQAGGCRRGITDFRQTTGVPRWRCVECDFDLCDKCIADPPNTEVVHPWHKHKLIRDTHDDGWRCDGVNEAGGCRRGITDFRQTTGVPRWRCVECDYDLCDKCIADPPRGPAPPSPSPPVSPRSPKSKSKTPEHTIIKPGTSAPPIDSFDGHFVEERFRRQVDKALTTIKTTLHNEREPTYPADVTHSYEDKYALAEFLTSGALACELNCFESLGLTDKHLKKILKWAESRSVTIRLKSEEKCKFDREETRKVESATEHVTEVKSSLFGAFKRTDKVVTKITEYFWKFDVEYELFLFKGNDPEDKIVLQTRHSGCEIVTTTKSTPRPEVRVVPSMDLNITWALQQIDADKSVFKFAIDRKSDECRTPRRNPQIYAALNHFAAFGSWARSVYSYFVDSLFPAQANHGLDLASLNAASVFIPVQPLFEEHSAKDKDNEASPKSAALIALPAGAPATSAVLPIGDLNTFLWEQKRSMSEKLSELTKLFPAPADAKLISISEANMLLVMQHVTKLAQHYSDSVDYIEDMLYKQLVAAIGKVITPADFANYMRFHNRKLFRNAFEPRPFCYAIRRPDHYPEGTVTIESQLSDGSLADPVFTTSRRITGAEAVPMRFPINAATDVVFGGDRYIHASVFHQFAGNSGQSLSLLARARQFSSFILIVGRIASAQVFDPKAAIVIQNKDDLKIPLLLETIPTAKEFKDAIESMSEEQQRFCKAYRAMQLESTLFGLVVIQIKPQLEKLLNLPYDSLTKEIRLTQDLMEMFIKYQIPSDQLSFDPLYCNQQNPSKEVKIAQVTKNVRAMRSMIEESQKKELEEAAKKAVYSSLDRNDLYVEEKKESMKRDMSPRGGKGAVPLKRMAVAAPAPKPTLAVVQKSAPAPTPAPAPAPQQAQPTRSEPAKPKEAPQGEAELPGEDEEAVGIDFTKIPAALDAQYEDLDEDAALRPTIINISPSWTKKYQKALLASPETQYLSTTEQSAARNVAFDLLDALTRSGALPIDCAELHVFIAATHCFERSIVDTVIQDNINPIEKIERSVLIMASTIQDKPVVELIKADQVERVQTYSPMLFPAAERPAIAEK